MRPFRKREGRHSKLILSLHSQHRPARDQHFHIWAGQQQVGQVGSRRENLLEVVEDQQHVPVSQECFQVFCMFGALICCGCVSPSVCLMVESTSPGWIMGASGTKATPSANVSSSLVATSIPSRVFPMPPVPVSVNKRTSFRCNSAHIAVISRSRPIKVVSCAGRF